MKASVDEGYRLLAAGYIRKQAKQLARQLRGVRKAEDVECVHQARVASRRLRAAIRMFGDCFGPKDLKRWRREIRRVTSDLGEARDKDVQIELLSRTVETLSDKACLPGIARLLVKLERQRERLQTRVVKAAKRMVASGVLEEMQAQGEAVLAEAEARHVCVQSPCALRQTGQHILRRFEELLPHEDSLADADDKERHHAMRIAAKRLRYTVEISKPVYDGRLDATIEAIKKVQTLLGEVHDCDVWEEQLEAFAAKQRDRILSLYGHPGPFARLEVGIEHLLQARREDRRRAFQELVEYWHELGREKHWEKLVETVRAGGERQCSCASGRRGGR